MAESGFTVFDGIGGRLVALSEGLDNGIEEVFERNAGRVLEYAKQNAPWNDRTGSARDGLETEVSSQNGETYLELAHTVDYGQWLETIQSGRFATIMPTLELFAADIFAQAGGVVTGSEGGDEGGFEGGEE